MAKITDKIKTFEDACKVLGINSEDFKITYPDNVSHHAKAFVAHMKLVIIAEALNEGWKPNWNDWDEWKYYPWFKMGSPSGGGFSYGDCGYWSAISYVGSRLCFKSRELAKYAGNQFEELYKEYFVLE